uniref:Sulfhydryl oxidase n=1 Tax=Chrysotila carterae TaxID=13221 RepID=A0A7S4BLL5_CHRCT
MHTTWSTQDRALAAPQLHTMAAYYPDKPDAEHSEQARSFLRALGRLYPCSYCAADFREVMEESPPRVGSREDLSLWLCEMHNRVNDKLGKPIFKCTLSELDRRWRKGGPECYEQ